MTTAQQDKQRRISKEAKQKREDSCERSRRWYNYGRNKERIEDYCEKEDTDV